MHKRNPKGRLGYTANTLSRSGIMVGEVRGFLSSGCKSCLLCRQVRGGYGDAEITGAYCGLTGQHFKEVDGYVEIPNGFPPSCKLKPIRKSVAIMKNKYIRIADEIEKINKILDE